MQRDRVPAEGIIVTHPMKLTVTPKQRVLWRELNCPERTQPTASMFHIIGVRELALDNLHTARTPTVIMNRTRLTGTPTNTADLEARFNGDGLVAVVLVLELNELCQIHATKWILGHDGFQFAAG